MHIVWFKRDLRIHDHSALTLAASKGTLLPLYILEPKLWREPDLSYRHYQFLKENNGILLLNDKSSPEDIYAELSMSKKAFKKAVGALFKQRKIVIKENTIELI